MDDEWVATRPDGNTEDGRKYGGSAVNRDRAIIVHRLSILLMARPVGRIAGEAVTFFVF